MGFLFSLLWLQRYLYWMDENLEKIGIDIITFQTEYADGQFELVTAPTQGIQSADNFFRLKLAVKEMTQQYRTRAGTRAEYGTDRQSVAS